MSDYPLPLTDDDLPLFSGQARRHAANVLDPPHSGRPTSRAAARSVRNKAAQDRERIQSLLARRGERGATDEEISLALQLAGNTVRPRRQELQKAGLVADSGRTRATVSGRPAIVWIVVEG